MQGVASIYVPTSLVQRLQDSSDSRSNSGMSIPETATALHIKQEVAYFLIQRKILEATVVKGPKREEWRVSDAQLKRFRDTYVFARDLAARSGFSSRKVISWLSAVGVHPCSGPRVDGGRQFIFRRDDLQRTELPLEHADMSLPAQQHGLPDKCGSRRLKGRTATRPTASRTNS